jgi:hypothetical protein
LHHFFEAQVRNQFSVDENVFVQRTCPSKKRDHLLSHTAFYFSIEKKKGLSCHQEMGCYKLTYDHGEEPEFFLEQAPEKIHAPELSVWVNPNATFEGVEIKSQTQGGPQDGFINIDKFVSLDFRGGLPPDYIGVFIAASYISTSNRFSGYNWIYNVTTNHSSVIEIDPFNLNNQGPFYYGEGHGNSTNGYGADHFGKNNLYSASQFPTMNFMADLTLYGREGGNYTEIGTVRYGFSFNNGILTPISPTITYKGQ